LSRKEKLWLANRSLLLGERLKERETSNSGVNSGTPVLDRTRFFAYMFHQVLK
jgi:hypothetical protein